MSVKELIEELERCDPNQRVSLLVEGVDVEIKDVRFSYSVTVIESEPIELEGC